MREKTISCIGSSYIPPILDLFEKMDGNYSSDLTHEKKAFTENGYAVSIISLSMQYLESLIKRVRFFSRSEHKKENSHVFFEKRYKSQTNLIQKCKEIYFVRNSIVHNFIWKRNYNISQTDYSESRIYLKFLKEEIGDRIIRRAVNPDDEKITKTLKLNVVPSNIGFADVKLFLKSISEILEFLEKNSLKGKFQPLSFNDSFLYKSNYYDFFEFVENFCN